MKNGGKALAISGGMLVLAGIAFVLAKPHTQLPAALDQSAPSLLANGELILDVIGANRCRIARYDARTKTLTWLTRSELHAFHPITPLTGSVIFFSRLDGSYQHIYRIDNNGGQDLTQLTTGDVIDVPLAVSQEESALYFRRENWHNRFGTPVYEIWKVSLRFASTPVFVAVGLSVTPDGQFIAKTQTPKDNDIPNILSRKLPEGPESYVCKGYSPSISFDGSQIVYTKPTSNWNHEIRLKKLSDGSDSILYSSTGPVSPPRFSFDGNRVICRVIASRHSRDEVLIITLSTRTVETIDVGNLADLSR